MRTIKFRGLRVDGKGWVNGSLINFKNKQYDITSISLIDGLKHEVKPETVGQLLSSFDRNGIDIYEGDKLIDKDNREYEVVYEYNLFCIKHSFFGTTAIKHNTHLRFEIIGNIHES